MCNLLMLLILKSIKNQPMGSKGKLYILSIPTRGYKERKIVCFTCVWRHVSAPSEALLLTQVHDVNRPHAAYKQRCKSSIFFISQPFFLSQYSKPIIPLPQHFLSVRGESRSARRLREEEFWLRSFAAADLGSQPNPLVSELWLPFFEYNLCLSSLSFL